MWVCVSGFGSKCFPWLYDSLTRAIRGQSFCQATNCSGWSLSNGSRREMTVDLSWNIPCIHTQRWWCVACTIIVNTCRCIHGKSMSCQWEVAWFGLAFVHTFFSKCSSGSEGIISGLLYMDGMRFALKLLVTSWYSAPSCTDAVKGLGSFS